MEMPSPQDQPFARMWLEFASNMAAAGAAAAPGSPPGDAPKQMRDRYFQTLAQYTEQYMRSPQFLDAMKQSTDAAVAFRKQTNELLAQAHHATGSLARPDMDSLLMAVRRGETRVMDKLDEIANKVDALESRLAAVESAKKKPARKAK